MTTKDRKLLVTRAFPKDVLARADRDYNVTLNPEDVNWNSDELIARAKGHEAIMCSSSNEFTAAVVAALPDSVEIVATFSVGYEHIDIDAFKARRITVTNTPDVLSAATADIAFMLLLCASRRAMESERMVRTGQWTGWTPTQLLGRGLQGKSLGILGMGSIGSEVAARARAFGMEIHYHNRSRLTADLELGAIYHETPEKLLKVSEFLSLNCPMTEEMRGFINAERIELMPSNAVVVNSARGGLIDDEAMIQALKSGRLFAAGLDVFDDEPNVNQGYWDLDNVFMTPHTGSATVETRNAMGFRALDNLDEYFTGKTPTDALTA